MAEKSKWFRPKDRAPIHLTLGPEFPMPTPEQVKAFEERLLKAPEEVKMAFTGPQEPRRRLFRNIRMLLGQLDGTTHAAGVLQDGISDTERTALEWIQLNMPTELIAVGHYLLDIDVRDAVYQVLQQFLNRKRYG